MKYVSLDIETTSLKPSPDHILMISMVVEDTLKPNIPVEDLSHFTCFVRHLKVTGEAYALSMNGWILDIISGRNKNPPPYPIFESYPVEPRRQDQCWEESAIKFLQQHFQKRITVAGKNVASFDMQFLPQALKDKFRHRVIDPAMLYFNPILDSELPGLEECKKRAGLETPVAHDAREDAMDVIRLMRIYYKGKICHIT